MVNFRFSGESIKFVLLFFHPCFVIIPIILNVLMYIILCKNNRAHKQRKIIKNIENNYTINMTNEGIIIVK